MFFDCRPEPLSEKPFGSFRLDDNLIYFCKKISCRDPWNQLLNASSQYKILAYS